MVRFEDTDEPEGKNGPSRVKAHQVKSTFRVRRKHTALGGIAREGSLIAPRGTVIGPSQISALAASGLKTVKVVRRPIIGVIATGDELVNPGRRLLPGRVYDCNSAAMASLIMHYGGIPRILGIARDNEPSLRAKIEKGMNPDAIVTTGGVSMGDFDLVRLILGKLGKVVFSRIKMGPEQPSLSA